MDIDLTSAWGVWLSGKTLDNYQLWGISFTWWSRIGLITQYVGALTIIADIIGPEKLREIGKKASRLYSVGMSFRWLKLQVMSILSVYLKDSALVKPEPSQNISTLKVLTSLSVLLFIVISWDVLKGAFDVMHWLFAVVVIFGAVAVVGIVITLFWLSILVIISAGLAVFDILVIHSLAWILEKDSADRIVKFVGIMFITFGFHFDLLGS